MKELLRMQHLQRRNSLSREQVAEKSKRIGERFLALPSVARANSILLYIGVKSEVQTIELAKTLLADGKRVIVPVTGFEKKEISLSELKSVEELHETRLGLLEPEKESQRPVQPKELELIVVPGIAFDSTGARIGTGFGFYDKLLRRTSSKVPLIGFCFEENFVERLPAESHDVKMGIVVTENRVVDCKA